ncbi:MAG: aminotransferase class V-fold PLP-dependent enzyme [Candidatus Dormiibacterota bacterium]
MTVTDFPVGRVRTQYPMLAETAYLNTGTYGLMATDVLSRHWELVASFERRGLAMEGSLRAQLEQVRERLAARINGKPSELALTGNATDGVAFVSMGLELQAGDEVIISDQEHPAMNDPWHYVGHRFGIRVRHFHASGDPAESLASIRSLLTPRTRLVGTSHITSACGIRLPVREICALAHEHGALALVDGAQSFAVTPIDVQEIGCDVFTSNGHKWLGGPKGTGFFWARSDLMRRLLPAYVGAGALVGGAGDDVVLQPDARRFEFGTRGFAVTGGLLPALDWFDELGWEHISARIQALTDRLKERLGSLEGVVLCTPRAWEGSGGLVTLEIPGRDEASLQRRFEAAALYPRSLGSGSSRIRVSCALFNSEDEIDRLVATLRSFLAEDAAEPAPALDADG